MARQNYFHLLGLDYNSDQEDFGKIIEIVKKKRAEWSRLRNHPSKGNQALANLEALKGIEEVMSNPELREAEANEARNFDVAAQAANEKKKFKSLDHSVQLVAKKGWVEEVEIKGMAEAFQLTVEEVKSRITFPIKNRPINKKSINNKINTTKAREIAECCTQLGIESVHPSGIASLYDYLQLSPSTSSEVLLQKANSLYKRLAVKGKSANNNLEIDLQSKCKSIFSNGREQYDQSLSQLRLQNMDVYLKVACAAKVLSLAVKEQLVKEAMNLSGKNEAEVEAYILAYCRTNEVEIEGVASNKVLSVIKCGFCGLINSALHHNCTKCASDLYLECPSCNSKTPSTDEVCGKCGFLVGNLVNVKKTMVIVNRLIRSEEYEQGKKVLEEILEWWPNYPEAIQKLNILEDMEILTQRKIERINDLVEKNYYYEARSLLVKERKLVQTSLSLQSMEKECLDAIHLAEGLVRRARNCLDEEQAAGFYFNAIEAAADCKEAKQMLAKWPPAPPMNLQVSLKSSEILLKWQESPSKGVITYRLLRKKKEPIQHFADGEILQESTECSFADFSAEGGVSYYYSVYAIRGSIVSAISLNQGPFFRRAEVSDLDIIQENDAIKLKWKVPDGASGIEVWRKENGIPLKRQDGVIVKGVTNNGVIDNQVVYGKTYGYRIHVIYDNNQLIYSEGATLKSKAVKLPEILKGLIVKRKKEGLELSWNETEELFDIYYSHSPFEVQKGDYIPLADLPSFEFKVKTNKTNQAVIDVNINKPVYILPVSRNDEVAVFGEVKLTKKHPEVSNVRHRIEGSSIVLQWDWPKDVKRVIITHRKDEFPVDPEEPQATRNIIEKGSYEVLDGYKFTSDERDYYFTMFVSYEDGEELVYSNGINYICMNSKPVDLTYFIKVRNSFISKKISLTISSDVPLSLPELVLVKKVSSVPTKKDSGKEIYRITPQRLEGSLQFDVPFEHSQKNSFAKLFFENEHDAPKIRLQAQGGKETSKLW